MLDLLLFPFVGSPKANRPVWLHYITLNYVTLGVWLPRRSPGPAPVPPASVWSESGLARAWLSPGVWRGGLDRPHQHSPAYNTLRHLDLSHLTALTSSTSEVEIPSPDLSLPSRSSSLAGLGRAGRQSQKRSLSTSQPAASQSLRRELVTFLIMWRTWHQALDIRY